MFQFMTVVIPTCLQSMASHYTRAAERELLAEEGMRKVIEMPTSIPSPSKKVRASEQTHK
jgi:hypothetical protein